MEFEWDPYKARANTEKHGVTFAEACEVFADQYSSSVSDPDHSIDEERHVIFGMSRDGAHLVVSYTERDDRIRIISARRMTLRERTAYEE